MNELIAILGPLKILTPAEKLRQKITALEKKRHDRIARGRLQGGSAGALNRDVANISHRIQLLEEKLRAITPPDPGAACCRPPS